MDKADLKWWQLSLLGIGCTIGTGYFLGSGIGIKTWISAELPLTPAPDYP